MNPDTLGVGRNPQLTDAALQELNAIIAIAWQTVTDNACSGVTTITPLVISRTGRDASSTPFNQLRAQVQIMLAPVATARTCVTG